MGRLRFLFLTALLLTFASVVAAAGEKAKVNDDGSIITDVSVGYIITGPEDAKCTADVEGAQRYSRKYKTIMVCGNYRNARLR